MPGPPRLQFSGEIFHIVTHGVARRAVFHDDGHDDRFTNGLADEVQRSAWDVIAYGGMAIFGLGYRDSSANLVRRARKREEESACYRRQVARAESQLAIKTEKQG